VRLPAEVLARALELIAARLGLQFPESRLPDIERGLLSVCRQEAVWPPGVLLVRLAVEADDSTLWVRLIAELTIGETYFFRDRAVFAALELHILPALIAARRAKGIRNLRLWSAGCATGEEPYSLAILLDRLLPDREEWALTILATDINVTTLQAAVRGCYRAWAMRETPPEIQDR
jgi:chemotaxis protein methyltransferase CheR